MAEDGESGVTYLEEQVHLFERHLVACELELKSAIQALERKGIEDPSRYERDVLRWSYNVTDATVRLAAARSVLANDRRKGRIDGVRIPIVL